MTDTAQFAITLLTVGGQDNAEATANTAVAKLDAFAQLRVKSRTTTAQPGSPAEGDIYIIPTGATGTPWSTNVGKYGLYLNGWIIVVPKEGQQPWVDDEDLRVLYDGTNFAAIQRLPTKTSITASTTQTQGQQPLTFGVNFVTTCANANDVVTLPTAAFGAECIVFNHGAQTLQVFPASGDGIGTGSVNASVTIAAGKGRQFNAADATTWGTVTGA